ncbi:penicillin-binding transpeptidase domain-containing protein [Occultella gossypii]|uniref:Serine hydrolase n=1 Tax=Occultella gossypii TaxID=2800820 RepID=A0ABS7SEV7_9MICO|nr:penicillin-binding transpeptidase domain-containing protein [Occultella gossypii]MBZ2198597.1 serine hydrolase [Occultella gossypii]
MAAGSVRFDRKIGIGLTLALLAGGLAACTDTDPDGGDDSLPPQEAAALAIAQALTAGTFDDAPLSDEDRALAVADTEAVLGALAPVPRAVEVSWVSSVYDEGEGRAADAALGWTWDVEGTDEDWSYPVSVHLVESDDTWTATWQRDLLGADLGETGVYDLTRTQPARGEVLGSGGEVIVTNRNVFRIGIDKTFIGAEEWEPAALALAEAVGLSDPQAYADRVLGAGPRAYLEAAVVAQEDPGSIDLDAVRALPGVNMLSDERQLGPTEGFAGPILGRVGEATAEIIAESDGVIVEGDMVGRSGLQRLYDEQLRGIRGTVISIVDGESVTEVYASDAVQGTALSTTLDAGLQILAESLLAPIEPASAIVAIRPSTGEILAAASGPGGDGLSTATVGQYAPGSTFKIVTLLALLRSGMGLDDTVSCTETVTVDGREFSNYPGYPAAALGDITLETAIAHSCNTALIAEYQRVGAADIASAAASLGLAATPELGFPYYLGSVPSEAAGTLHAADLIGQGQVLASPLAMATVAASVAAGARVEPYLLSLPEGEPTDAGATDGATDGATATAEATGDADDTATDDSTGDADDTATDATDTDVVALTNEEAAQLRAAMRAVVSYGTASAQLTGLDGDDVGAKSGTAEFGDADQTHAWMIAYDGDLAVAAFVEVGDYGSATSGPLIRSFLEVARQG